MMPISKVGTSKHRRFTLFELVAVVLVLGILVGVVAPRLNLSGLGRGRFRQAVSRLRSVMTQARDRAASAGTVNTLHLDVASGSYHVTAERPDGEAVERDPVGDLRGVLPEGMYVVRVVTSGGETMSDKELIVRFHPQGWADPVRIYLGSDDDLRTMLEVTLAATLVEFPERTW